MSDRKLASELEELFDRIECASIGTLGAYETIQAMRAIIDGDLRAEDVDLGALDDDNIMDFENPARKLFTMTPEELGEAALKGAKLGK